MKSIIFILFLILNFGCTTTFDINSIENKKFVGNVIGVRYVKNYITESSTEIKTDILNNIDENLFIWEKVKIKKGTPCYIFANKTGTEIYLIWDGAKQPLLIK